MTPTTVARGIGTIFVLLYSGGMALSALLDIRAERIFAHVPTAAVLLMIAFDAWAWKREAVGRLFGRPRLEGTWIGEIQPSPESKIPEGGNRGPIPAAWIIHQTYFTIHVTQFTAESTSYSTATTFARIGDSGSFMLAFLYGNKPKKKFQARSGEHSGACEVHVPDVTPNELHGTYWTGRYTAGDVTMTLFERGTKYGSLAAVNRAQSVRLATAEQGGRR